MRCVERPAACNRIAKSVYMFAYHTLGADTADCQRTLYKCLPVMSKTKHAQCTSELQNLSNTAHTTYMLRLSV